MTVQASLKSTAKKIRSVRYRESRESSPWKRRWLATQRWALLLYHEFVRDDVRIRAESLSYLMIFSLLPLLAGCFFLFSIFAQFGMVQEAITELIARALSTIPEAHRGFVEGYVLEFKDAYLKNLADKSSSLGIFALFILVWVGLQAFDNVDRTLNRIWGASRERPFTEKLRNFLVVAVAAPLVVLSALSLPHVLVKVEMSRDIVQRVPFLLRLLNLVIVPALVLGTFACLYRFVPVQRVYWRSALGGAVFATAGLELTNVLMGYYFRFGTNTAYGKAAVLPLIGFWIYLLWVIVIMGAELSFLLQNQRDVVSSSEREPTLREAHGIVLMLREMLDAHRNGKIPVTLDRLDRISGIESGRARELIVYLQEKKLVVECAGPDCAYALGRDVATLPVADILRDFVGEGWNIDDSRVSPEFHTAFDAWVGAFDGTIGDLIAPSKRQRQRDDRKDQ